KFLPRFKIRTKHTKHTACHHGHIRPVHSSRCHTFVSTFDDDTNPGGLENAVEAGGDLGGHFFLDLHSLGINVNQSHKLRNADDAFARQVADVNPADDRRHVMLAMRFETDIAQQHHLVITGDFLECALQIATWILEIAREPFLKRPNDASWRSLQSLPGRIVARPSNEGSNGLLGGRPRRTIVFAANRWFPIVPRFHVALSLTEWRCL